MIDFSRLDSSIERAIAFLYERQLPYGEFKTYKTLCSNPEDQGVFEHVPLTTSLIAHSLSFWETERTQKMISNALDFLSTEMEEPGLWRTWSSQSIYHKVTPPDMDDTCCASFLLKKYRTAPGNVELLLANRSRHGTFFSWITPSISKMVKFPRFGLSSMLERPNLRLLWQQTEAEPDDIDFVANANAVCYLQEREETKAAIRYLCEMIERSPDETIDKWYLSIFPAYYFLSRAYYHGVQSLEVAAPKIVEVLDRLILTESCTMNRLEFALAACTLINFNYLSPSLDHAIHQLVEGQTDEGGWVIFPFYYGGPQRYWSWGSPELTTGFCLEALSRYRLISQAHG